MLLFVCRPKLLLRSFLRLLTWHWHLANEHRLESRCPAVAAAQRTATGIETEKTTAVADEYASPPSVEHDRKGFTDENTDIDNCIGACFNRYSRVCSTVGPRLP